jgi:hypothetical protein
MTFRQTLQHFENYLNTARVDMRIDYISLTRTCNRLLGTLGSELRDKFNVEYKFHTIKVHTGNTGNEGLRYHDVLDRVETLKHIFTDAAEASALHEELKRMKNRSLDLLDVPPAGTLLSYAAEYLRRHLVEAGRS